MITLLFSWDYQFLGEFLFEKGACARMTWTAEGTALYGAEIDDWQTLGIQTFDRLVINVEENEYGWAHRRTSLRSADAQYAFLRWVSKTGSISVDLPERLLPFWQKLCLLHVEPQERFASLQSMRQATHNDLMTWDKALDQVLAKEGMTY